MLKLIVAALAALTVSAHAMRWDMMRPSINIEDRRPQKVTSAPLRWSTPPVVAAAYGQSYGH